MKILVGIVVIVFSGAVLFMYAMRRSFSQLPRNNIDGFIKNYVPTDDSQIVVCVGDSLTHASISADYVAPLRKRFPELEFVNAGMNGQLSDNVLKRLDPIIQLKPVAITLLIGTNDVNATVSDENFEMYQRDHDITEIPTPEHYRSNLEHIIRQLKRETTASLAILSLPPLGEDLGENQNQKVNQYSGVIQDVAQAEDITYLPFHERCVDLLNAQPNRSPQPYTTKFQPMLLAGAKHYLLQQSWNKISHGNGMTLLTDFIHLNDLGAEMVADLIGAFLEEQVISN